MYEFIWLLFTPNFHSDSFLALPLDSIVVLELVALGLKILSKSHSMWYW